MKQDPFSGYRALTPKEMAEKLMSPNIPKTEAEHWAMREIKKQRAEIERLREALRWYADRRNHFPVEHRRPGDPDPAVIFVEEPPIMIDGGKRARNALEGKP